jgi:peptidyl-prolyl cis-trans isomerase C
LDVRFEDFRKEEPTLMPEDLLASALASGFHRTIEDVIAKSTPPEDAKWDISVEAHVESSLAETERALTAEARHILVSTFEESESLRRQFEQGNDSFASLAEEHSSCPTKHHGGHLGKIQPGSLVDSVDQVIFNAPLEVIQGPTKSEFGYHLIMVEKRSDADDHRLGVRIRVNLLASASNFLLQVFVQEAYDTCPLISSFRERGDVSVVVLSGSGVWRLDLGPTM